ncbi:MAG: Fe-S cluster assembly protein SufD [Cyanobacteria bacterium CRU_2_1]|nr:Fe-S cluster assembly protein SufD [Cyanobacteria bacterium RU_5_0]NJR61029.1 Fe-S cluster assembly protein SufD [Cyanobacteria bacterium CRU_2_1]
MSIQVSADLIPSANPSGTSSSHRQTALMALLSHRSPLDLPSIASDVTWLHEVRDRAAARVQELAIPSTREEEWRFTDLSPLMQTVFHVPKPTTQPAYISLLNLPEASEHRLVFVNGVYKPHLSIVPDLPTELFIGNLSQLPSERLAHVQNYLTQQPGAEEVFTTLNTASFADVAIVWIPKNLVVETPLHLLFVSTAEATSIAHPRGLVIAETGSCATLVEEYWDGQAEDPDSQGNVYFTNAVTEIWLDANAQVTHTRIQAESKAAFHIGKTAVSQARDSRYTCNAISFGAKLSRHNLEIYQTGEQTETTLNGLTLIGGEQLADTHSAIALTKPHSTTRQLHKCIVDDRAHAVFNGKVFVPKAAQLTDAGQLNRNLLLSPKARVDTKPQLEIVADNVKCTHGATVGQLDTDEVFYLQSRGIDAASARNLLIYAFAYEILGKIAIDSLQQKLSQLVTSRT